MKVYLSSVMTSRTPLIVLFFISMVLVAQAQALTFDSRSNGSDGVLDFSGVPAGTVIFDPKDASTFDPANPDRKLDVDNDNVFHFTSVKIPNNVEVVLRADKLLWRPVYWLAQSDIVIEANGQLILTGADGHAATSQGDARIPSIPGPGGFPGGIGASLVNSAKAGFGPGAGLPSAADGDGGGASHTTVGIGNFGGTAGPVYGSPYLLPLVGGSGGAGGGNSTATQAASRSGGGAGGGAIVLASSTQVIHDGYILAEGGYGTGTSTRTTAAYGGGSGSGGSVRIMAPTIIGNHSSRYITVRGGRGSGGAGHGRIRLEAFTNKYSGRFFPDNADVVRISGLVPTTAFLPTDTGIPGWPSVRVDSINNVALPTIPTGSFVVPDSEINTLNSVPITFVTENIPTTADLTLFVISPDNETLVISPSYSTGTTTSATWGASVTFPPGFSRGFVKATWIN